MKRKKVLIFYPFNIGDIAVVLNCLKPFVNPTIQYALACQQKTAAFALNTGIVEKTFIIDLPWTNRNGWINKNYWKNPFHYNFILILSCWYQIVTYKPAIIINMHFDNKTVYFLKIVTFFQTKVVQHLGNYFENVYYKEAFLASILDNHNPIKLNYTIRKPNKIAVFGGAYNVNRRLPDKKMLELLLLLNNHKIDTILIVSTMQESIFFTEKITQEKWVSVQCIHGNLIEIIKQMLDVKIMISTDTSWLHIAELYEIKTIGLYGFDNLETWKPPNTIPIKSNPIYTHKNMYEPAFKNVQPLINIDCVAIFELCKKLLSQI
ncbi:MAG: hypothetical protein ORN58_08140 [Sediminibacterium sp.]|nr:hypothetical protein [Sediminibacterium sp.]